MSTVIPIASDHAGYQLKKTVISHLEKKGYKVKDYGTYSEESVDYPDFVHHVGHDVNYGVYPFGIVICGSGNGAQMTVNKYPNVRCALCWTVELASLAKAHNNANILALPARFIPEELAIEIVDKYLATPFEGGRHQRRIDKVSQLLPE